MNRRTFTAGLFATAIAVTLPTQAKAQSTGDCIIISQEYGEETYLPIITHNAVWLDNEDATKAIFTKEVATALDSTDSFFLRELVDAPTLGDESVAIVGKHEANAFWFQVRLRTGVVIQKFTFEGEDRDALIADSIAMTEAALARQEHKDKYTDAELFALLLTEEETGLAVIDQQYDAVQYNLDNL